MAISKRYLVGKVPISDRCDQHGLQPSQVFINVHSAALNFPDMLLIAGKYQVKGLRRWQEETVISMRSRLPFKFSGKRAGDHESDRSGRLVRAGHAAAGSSREYRVFGGLSARWSFARRREPGRHDAVVGFRVCVDYSYPAYLWTTLDEICESLDGCVVGAAVVYPEFVA